jgi:hypothetical protein
MTLPTDPNERKNAPVYSGFLKYFPDAIVEVARLSKKGNDQHNPGSPLHWDRSKSGDELDALTRHLLDEASGNTMDTDDVPHLAKVAWRAMAALQKACEKRQSMDMVSAINRAAQQSLREHPPLVLDWTGPNLPGDK